MMVAIFGRDRVVGQALELLLRDGGYDARFVADPVMDKLDELLAEAQLLLFGPTLSTERRESLLDGLRDAGTANIPVLELITTPARTRDGQGRHVMWPCPTEELLRQIGEVLLSTTGFPEDHPEGRRAITNI